MPSQALLDVEDALVLQPLVLPEEDVRALPRRRRDLLVVVEGDDPVGERFPEGNLFEVPERHLVLRLDPGRGVGSVVVLEPAVRIGDSDAVIRVDLVDFPRFRVLELLCERGRRRGEGDD